MAESCWSIKNRLRWQSLRNSPDFIHPYQSNLHTHTHALSHTCRITLWLLSILLIDPYSGCAAFKLLSLLTRLSRESASSSGLTASLLFWEPTACTTTRKQNKEQQITGLNTHPFSQPDTEGKLPNAEKLPSILHFDSTNDSTCT